MKSRRSPITGRLNRLPSLIKPGKSRKIIRKHHQLLKQKALTSNAAELALIESELEKNGGIDAYQRASISGQSNQRGGDSSKILMKWLKEEGIKDVDSLLEVGCLSASNACSKANVFANIQRIDLNSQEPEIEQQDLMERPLPKCESERFSVISLSLVLNYVDTPQGRGEMLQRTTKFLKKDEVDSTKLCGLFFVLPSPCVSNSRYCTEELLDQIMTSLGYKKWKRLEAKKIIYWFYKWNGKLQKKQTFPKQLVNDGPARNNFAIVLK